MHTLYTVLYLHANTCMDFILIIPQCPRVHVLPPPYTTTAYVVVRLALPSFLGPRPTDRHLACLPVPAVSMGGSAIRAQGTQVCVVEIFVGSSSEHCDVDAMSSLATETSAGAGASSLSDVDMKGDQAGGKKDKKKKKKKSSTRTPAQKRLMRDFKKITTDAPTGISAAPVDMNILSWQAVIFGPDESPWSGGTFNLLIDFSEEYPNKPPNVRFVTKMFHPNVYADGRICLDILKSAWSPIFDIGHILISIQSLLCDPNPDSPANSEASKIYQEDRREYNNRVRQCVEGSWA